MSEDDGMFLNFVASEDTSSAVSPLKSNSKATGGRWKDRRRARRAVLSKQWENRKRNFEAMNHSAENFKDLSEVESADGRYGGDTPQARTSDQNGNVKRRAPNPKLMGKSINSQKSENGTRPLHTSRASVPNQQIVSSLFTSNREASTSVNTNEHDDAAAVTSSNAPLEAETFERLGIQEPILSHLAEKMNIQKPTSIQKMAIPPLLNTNNESDLFIHAQTGSGKTLAYLLPILSSILSLDCRIDRKSGCFALIVAPTRELANQIYGVIQALTNCCHYLVPCLLIGGVRKKSEKARLRKGANFIIGTPGRILDHLQNTNVVGEQLAPSLRYVVLDEGDQLMDLGFEETITQILQIVHNVKLDTARFPKLPSRIVHVLCSATLKENVTKLGKSTLRNYRLVSNNDHKDESGVGEDVMSAAPDQLLQKITVVPPKLRLVTLAAALNNATIRHRTEHPDAITRTIVFLSCADSVEFHYEVFSKPDSYFRTLIDDTVRELTRGCGILPCLNPEEDPNVVFYKLHGSLSQQVRTATLKHFATDDQNAKSKHLILFCTDVASRGLDLPHVSTVIEMDPPFVVQDHLHRIGRTARAGRSGESLLFLLPGEEEGYMDYIKKYHRLGWKLLKFDDDILKKAFGRSHVSRNDISGLKKKLEPLEWDINATTWHLNVERRILNDPSFKELSTRAFLSHIRSYTTHVSSEKKYFNIKFLHLGHLAKSFGLRERPKAVGLSGSKQKKDGTEIKRAPKESSKDKMLRMARMAAEARASEFNY